MVDKNKIDDGAAVTWVIAGEGIDVATDEQTGSGGNSVRCELLERLALGDTSPCTLRPEGAQNDRVTLNLSTALLR